MTHSFKENVLRIVRNIPEGNTLSYKEVATEAGNPRAARAVGAVVKANTDTTVPCHRVIRSDGTLGDYNGLRGTSKQTLLLKEQTHVL